MKTGPINLATDCKSDPLLGRLSCAVDAIEKSLTISAEHAQQVMEQRTSELARAGANTHTVENRVEMVQFAIHDEVYAIETKYVREVIRAATWTPTTRAPDFLAGVTNLRGEIVALLDLAKLFRPSSPKHVRWSHILVLGHDWAEFGIVTTAVYGVVDLPFGQNLSIPDSLNGAIRDFVMGVTRDAQILLNGALLLSDTRLVIDESAELLA